VLLYVNNNLKSTAVSVKSEFPEHIWCNIKGPYNDELLVGVCYRTYNDSIFGHGHHEELRDLLKEVGCKRFLIMGDFNYSNIQW